MRVVIVGAGIIGLASAYELARNGHEVMVVEAHKVGSGASFGNAGWVVPAQSGPLPAPGVVVQSLRWMLQADSPLYIRPSLAPGFIRFMLTMWRHCNHTSFRHALRAHLRLGEGTMDLLDRYAEDGVEFEMHRQGLLQVFASQAKFDHHLEDLQILRGAGFESRVLRGSELTEQEPALTRGLHGGIFFPHERHVRPDSLTAGLAKRCAALGVHIMEAAAVTGVRFSGSRVSRLETEGGPVTGDVFLLAAGAWTGQLARKFGVRLPIRPGKGYSVDYAPAPVTIRSAVKLMERQVVFTPLDGGLRLAGTMEFAGLDNSINEVRVQAVRRAPGEYLEQWGNPAPSGPPWAGARPMTPDGMPVIGRLHSLENCYVASGHGMLGLTLGPATGAAVAEAITSERLPATLEAFSPRRFRA